MQLQKRLTKVNDCYPTYLLIGGSLGAIVCTIAIVSARTSTTGREVGSEPGISRVASWRTTLKNSSSPTQVPVRTPLWGSTGQSVTREFARAKAQSSRAGEGIKSKFHSSMLLSLCVGRPRSELIMMSADQQPSKRTIRPLTLVMRLLHKYISYVLPLQMNHQ